MNKYLTFLLGALLIGCSSKETNNELNQINIEFSYSIDTVMVDAKDHFFFLNWGLGISDLTQGKKLLYNLNPESLLLEVVDLDALALAETIQLEKEGPNGIGAGYISKLQVLGNGNLILFDFNKIVEISPKGELVKKYKFDKNTLSGYEFGETDVVSYLGTFSPDGKTYVGQLEDEDFRKPAKGLAIIDLEKMELNFVPTDAISKLDEFRIMLEMNGNAMMSTGEDSYTKFINGELILSNSAMNEVYIYDFEMDSLLHKTFEASLTGNERIKNFPTQVDTQEALFASSNEKNKQVKFGPMILQKEKNLIWRISTDLDRMIADSVVTKDVVTFFDTDYTMLKEQPLENYITSSTRFFKDGMLYSFMNLDDELAFVRLKPSIEK
ncbi:DUF4221 domain-containing protein [Algoriphagus machipongonensis]|uniref:Lipoprotein n=1 Tax=Algoriphagus machipongonensis TaxID=388413 RepID=A3HUC3_9BACT|nr:DUF4221 domain-containing protein [Algoriphagus machipongonensis]EAZ81745.1 hypothetical protein ALPR1_00850 [Algoriphagus machipongonensis]